MFGGVGGLKWIHRIHPGNMYGWKPKSHGSLVQIHVIFWLRLFCLIPQLGPLSHEVGLAKLEYLKTRLTLSNKTRFKAVGFVGALAVGVFFSCGDVVVDLRTGKK